jgi:hypothetical protein
MQSRLVSAVHSPTTGPQLQPRAVKHVSNFSRRSPGTLPRNFEAVPLGQDPRSDLASKLPCLEKVALGSGIRRARPACPRLSNPRQGTGLASSSAVARVTILSRCPTSMPLTLHVPVASRRQAGWLGTREADSGSPNTSDDALCSSVAICPVLDPLSSDETWPRSRGPSDLQLFGCICLNHRAMLSYPSPTRAGFLLLVTEP